MPIFARHQRPLSVPRFGWDIVGLSAKGYEAPGVFRFQSSESGPKLPAFVRDLGSSRVRPAIRMVIY